MMNAGFIKAVALTVGGALLIATAARAADGPAAVLDIRDDPAGGKVATATVRIPAPPAAVRAVLGDYERWPELFDGRFTVAKLDRLEGRVVTDLRIKRTPLPGTMRLVCETRESPGGEIVTSLVEGDFKRYRRQWTLVPETTGGAVHTQARMEMTVDPEMWTPGWLFARMLRSDLETHFVILRERAVAQMAGR
jgi:ribosome-associated toxin RatA of RatAB toxin-antitoxin module